MTINLHGTGRTGAIELAISGMSCASCAGRVETVLKRVPGVTRAAVNLASETARVEMDKPALAPLLAAVARAGYEAAERAQRKPGSVRAELVAIALGAALTVPLLAGMVLPLPGWLALVLATPVQVGLGARFYRNAWRALRHGTANMDVLVALGSSAAFLLSLTDLLHGSGPLYFESAAVIVVLVRLGKYLEAGAKREAAGVVAALASLRPAVAHRVEGGAVWDVPPDRLVPGDVVELRAGERVPADGTILSGEGSLDEAPITGEALRVPRGPGETVMAGTLNLTAVLRIRITAAAGETFVDRMARLLGEAQASKPRAQRLVDRVSAVFVPVVVALAGLTFLAWWLGLHAPVPLAVLNAVSVLVIACPCALGLAAPAAVLAATGAAARRGILIRDADALARAGAATLVVFDKTGTLTAGRPVLASVLCAPGQDREAALGIAAALAAADTHPLAAALRRADAPAASSVQVTPGRGVEGVVGGRRYRLGNEHFIGQPSPFDAPPGATLSLLAEAGGAVLAGFAFADAVRFSAAPAVAALHGDGVETMLLSGDRAPAARAVAAGAGIPAVQADAGPDEKLAAVQAAQAAGKIVMMVGDGVNDAACLAAADVGVAIGSGADVAIEAADVAILRPDLMLIPELRRLGRRTAATLRQGLFWALAYNCVGIPLAACGLLNPMIAAAAMALSSVSVLGNALRLRRA